MLSDGRKLFLKSNHQSSNLFHAEARGLAAIAATNTLRVPDVVGVGSTPSGMEFLILELIESGRPKDGFFEKFGRKLALMHKRGRNEQYGFDADNYIGSTLQPNAWNRNWVEFWAEKRIRHQLRLATDNGFGNSELVRLGERLISQLDQSIGSLAEGPALIHGDLWSGNYLISATGDPVLIDPAVYFGSRESEFGMTTLFGGFGSEFYDAYNEVWPLNDGWEIRTEIYKLYHLINHLNLFGSGYLDSCLDLLKKLT